MHRFADLHALVAWHHNANIAASSGAGVNQCLGPHRLDQFGLRCNRVGAPSNAGGKGARTNADRDLRRLETATRPDQRRSSISFPAMRHGALPSAKLLRSASTRFICGVPMKLATKTFSGLAKTS